MTGSALLVAALLVTFLVLGEYTRKARVSGHLVPDRGVIRLVATQPATVVESHVVEGRSVHRGDILFVLAVGQVTSSGDTQAAVQETLVSREKSLRGAAQRRHLLEKSQLAGLDRQIADLSDELVAMKSEFDLQSQRLVLAQQAHAQFESLRKDNFISAAQVRTKAEEVLNVRAQLQSLERQRSVRQREIASLQVQRRELPLKADAAQGEIERDLAALAQQSVESEARQRIVVRAPQDGMISGVLAAPGQSVNPSVALASLLPAGAKLQAQLFAPSSAVGFVRAKQSVQLRYQAFPYQKFGHQAGEVIQVSRSPLQPSELAGLSLPASASASGEPLYRITVALDRQSVAAYGEAQALSPGMQLEADVLLDRRRLIEWLFEPVLGIAGRV
ncbi:MAG: HlyD family efflux transporter periplasmic adaptor subunit [Burkholderiaceae bacterium]